MSMYTIFVGNCSGASRREIEDEFRQFGKIMHIALHKTYAFVDFDSKDAADDAIRVKHHSLFRGKPLTVEPSDSKSGPKKNDGGGRGGGGGGGPSRDRERSRGREFRDERGGRGGPGGGGGFSPPPMQGRPDLSLEARLREVAERERLIELEQQIMIKEQRAQEMLIAQEMEKRKIEMMEMERAASSMGGPPPGRQQQHQRPPSPLGGHPPSHQARHEGPSSHHFDARDHDFEPPAPKRRATSGVAFGSIDHPDIFRNMLDCCVIYVDKQLRSYAESVQSVCVSAGLTADVQFISRDESLAGTLDNLSQKGIISAVILDELNEQRKTANVHLLHGTPRGEIQTGIAELPHWLRMHEEYNKYLIVSGKRSQSIRELLAELCGDAGRGDSPGMGGGGGNGMMNGPPPSLGPGDRDRERDRMPGGGGHHNRGGPSSMPPPPPTESQNSRSSYMR